MHFYLVAILFICLHVECGTAVGDELAWGIWESERGSMLGQRQVAWLGIHCAAWHFCEFKQHHTTGASRIGRYLFPRVSLSWWISMIGLQHLNQLHQGCATAHHPQTLTRQDHVTYLYFITLLGMPLCPYSITLQACARPRCLT